MDWIWGLWIYIIIINVIAFIIMGMDKAKSRKRMLRIRETSFFSMAFLGGALGIWLGMNIFRHKTRHKKFTWGIPIILALQIILLFWIGGR